MVATNHSVATGTVVDMATGYPGYNSVIPREAVAIGEILRQHGYDTSWYGGARGLEANHRGRPPGWRLAAMAGLSSGIVVLLGSKLSVSAFEPIDLQPRLAESSFDLNLNAGL